MLPALTDPILLGRRMYEAPDIMRRFPPVWSHRNKQVVAEVSCPPGTKHSGTITVTRWRENGVPDAMPAREPAVVGRPGFFSYPAPDGTDPTTHWHMNFADAELFGFGEGQLLAQDELQCAEHPALVAVRKAMIADGTGEMQPRTVEGNRATPVLVMNVERRCSLDGLYGNAFAAADEAAVRRATTRLPQASPSNILAIAAPAGGRGAYVRRDIERILGTAHAGFRAAVLESPRGATVHTGFWGCGAFGGNRILMTAAQILAAWLAGVDTVEFLCGSTVGDERAYVEGKRVAKELSQGGAMTAQVIERLAAMGYLWGMSDGN